jgi:hypothetical protein
MTFPTRSRTRFRLDELTEAWATSGGRLHSTDAGACVVSHCRSMAFVGLKTDKGARPVCLRHFEMLQAAAVPAA